MALRFVLGVFLLGLGGLYVRGVGIFRPCQPAVASLWHGEATTTTTYRVELADLLPAQLRVQGGVLLLQTGVLALCMQKYESVSQESEYWRS